MDQLFYVTMDTVEPHEANFGIVSALDRAIPELQQMGFNFVTIDDLLATGSYIVQP